VTHRSRRRRQLLPFGRRLRLRRLFQRRQAGQGRRLRRQVFLQLQAPRLVSA
jgi:hypothetical protein